MALKWEIWGYAARTIQFLYVIKPFFKEKKKLSNATRKNVQLKVIPTSKSFSNHVNYQIILK